MPTGVYPEFFSTANDYKTWTNTIAGTFFSRQNQASVFTSVVVPVVLWTAIRKGNLPADAFLLAFDRTFRLPGVLMNGIVPKAADLFRDDQGVLWMVGKQQGSVEIINYGNDFRIHCIKDMRQQVPVVT